MFSTFHEWFAVRPALPVRASTAVYYAVKVSLNVDILRASKLEEGCSFVALVATLT